MAGFLFKKLKLIISVNEFDNSGDIIVFFYSESQAENSEPYFTNVTLLLKGDGTNGSTNIIDSSNNNFSVTASGNAAISTAQSKYGGSSLYFDGIGDYLDIASSNSSAFVFGTNNFTVEFWIKSSSSNGNLLNPASLSGDGFWGVIIQNSNLRWNNSYNSTNLWAIGCSSILENNWHHVAISRNSGTVKVYFDGVLQNTFIDTTNYTYFNGSSDGLRIGKGNLADFNGYIDDLRITKGVGRYTTNFTPPTAL